MNEKEYGEDSDNEQISLNNNELEKELWFLEVKFPSLNYYLLI